MNNSIKLAGIITVVGMSLAGSAKANLIVNGSFENPRQSSWNQYTSIQGWSSKDAKIEVGLGSVHGVTGYDGRNVLELDSTANAKVSQSAKLKAGKYDLSFLYARRQTGMTGRDLSTCDFNVLWNGSLIWSARPTLGKMTEKDLVLTAKSGFNTLTFQGAGKSDSYGALIDNVKLNAAPVPEPASMAALLVGGVGLLRRRRAAKA